MQVFRRGTGIPHLLKNDPYTWKSKQRIFLLALGLALMRFGGNKNAMLVVVIFHQSLPFNISR